MEIMPWILFSLYKSATMVVACSEAAFMYSARWPGRSFWGIVWVIFRSVAEVVVVVGGGWWLTSRTRMFGCGVWVRRVWWV